MGSKYAGPAGGRGDPTVGDPGTSRVGRNPAPGPVCRTNDPNVLQKTGYVLEAWGLAKVKYAGPAIVRHTSQEFLDAIRGALPVLLLALGTVLTTTVIGALVGSVAGGVGAVPGAVAGAAVGLAVLEGVGLGFLAIYVGERLADVLGALAAGAAVAWGSCGNRATLESAAWTMAEGVGLFYSALLNALLQYLAAAMVGKTLAAARKTLRGTKLFRLCENLEAYLTKNFKELYEKHVGKAAPGRLPPVTQSAEEWAAYVQSLEFKPPRDKGVLWSRLGGPKKAVKLVADADPSLVTLEKLLEENGFQAAYDEVFQGAETAATREIWRLLSEKYARSLSGKVVAFVDKPSLTQAIKDSPFVSPRKVTGSTPGGKPIHELPDNRPALTKAPQVTNELMAISDEMLKNANITSVEIRDVSNPAAGPVFMTRDLVLQSAATKH